MNQTVLAPALPKLMESFQINAGTAQWVTSIYMLVNGIMVPISGYLIDRFPTRKLFFASMTQTFIAGTVLCALAPGFEMLIVGRILQAAGAGVQLPLVAVVPMLIFLLKSAEPPWAWRASSCRSLLPQVPWWQE